MCGLGAQRPAAPSSSCGAAAGAWAAKEHNLPHPLLAAASQAHCSGRAAALNPDLAQASSLCALCGTRRDWLFWSLTTSLLCLFLPRPAMLCGRGAGVGDIKKTRTGDNATPIPFRGSGSSALMLLSYLYGLFSSGFCFRMRLTDRLSLLWRGCDGSAVAAASQARRCVGGCRPCGGALTRCAGRLSSHSYNCAHTCKHPFLGCALRAERQIGHRSFAKQSPSGLAATPSAFQKPERAPGTPGRERLYIRPPSSQNRGSHRFYSSNCFSLRKDEEESSTFKRQQARAGYSSRCFQLRPA